MTYTALELPLRAAADFLWGPPLMALLIGTGIYLTVGLRGISLSRVPEALRLMLSAQARAKTPGAGEISPFAALMSALSATVGVGNIAGVATAIHLGGPGALVWMWATGAVGMATKYAEAFLSIHYRETNGSEYRGGPMYYIKLGMGPRWAWLGVLYAGFAAIAALGVGAGIQGNAVADILSSRFDWPPIYTAAVLTTLTFLVLVGGLQRIAAVSEWLAPFMIVFFIGIGIGVIALNAVRVPAALALIARSAFTGTAAVGGFAGAAIAQTVRFGVARGLFSNEAGLGSAAILHAASRSDDPVRIGALGMLGAFIDTLMVNSVTGLTIVVTGVWSSGLTAAPLTALAFETAFPGIGSLVVTISLVLFAFTTIIGWSFYGERCVGYLFGAGVGKFYRLFWCAAVFAGAVAQLDTAWLVADIMNALMAVPNLIALIALSPVVFAETRARLSGGRPLAPARAIPLTMTSVP